MKLTAVGICLVSVLAAQQTKQPPPAPVPAQVIAAKKVFIGNAGVDPVGGQSYRAYESFYAAMKAWRRYELVAAPSDADLLFELRLAVRAGDTMLGSSSYNDVRLRLVIRDPKTHALLWAFTKRLGWLTDKNVDQAVAGLVIELQRLTAQ